ncbi:hypothetical protein BU14_0240s0013 [Porphyra umbilicalis]|uniref:Uncharacterized protein n=1 Tax=Porphyra umbilicalis TaxID=2786 RepID=A0A1X6P3J2_PORUM|nr:hypothetical protein BU14_0240s0013 [Porphyra umbilicalis]|eukprot:OSX75335.1 hypothetical protein BU14_0240s0013 [Porphyra umbilicalis]
MTKLEGLHDERQLVKTSITYTKFILWQNWFSLQQYPTTALDSKSRDCRFKSCQLHCEYFSSMPRSATNSSAHSVHEGALMYMTPTERNGQYIRGALL